MPVLSLLDWAKLAGVLAVAIAIGAAVIYWRHLENEAALVPQLSARVSNDDAQAAALSQRLAAVDKARADAERTLSAWQSGKTLALQSLDKEGQHAAASTTPVCAPSAADQRLRNDTIGQLTRFGGAAGAASVPSGAVRPH